jgi:organic radical activating enzyme
MKLKVNDIFYSLQGEGVRQGEASIFVRLSGCNLRCEFCDTDHEKGEDLTLEEILEEIKPFRCQWIVWTGGEPSLQLTDEVFSFFKKKGYFQAIESNGHRRLSGLLDYTVVSPKGEDIWYARRMNPRVDELRLPVEKGQYIPPLNVLPEARHYCLSPIFTAGKRSTGANVRYCVEYVRRHPEWRLSMQMHKMIGID